MNKSMTTLQIDELTTFNLKFTNETKEKGYVWNSDLSISIQTKCAVDAFKEIRKMIELNKYTIELTIKLNAGNIVYFKYPIL